MGFKMPSFLSGSDAGIERLTITSHQLRDCTDGPQSTFKVQVNPKELSYSFGYNGVGKKENESSANTLGGPGQSGTPQGFSAYNEMGMKFVFHADATGLLPIDKGMEKEFMNGTSPSIRLHLNKLQDTVYGYDEEIHGPRYLKLVWGKVFPNSNTKNGENNPAVYKAMLKKCDIKITLFSLKGEPVKAEITLDLQSQMAPEERPLGKSPDLTHYYEITEGDKMTSYCEYIYGRYDSKICSAIAEYNNMIDWKLQGGTKIIFPSIHMLEDKYLKDYEEVDVEPVVNQSEEEQMRDLIGEKRTAQYYKVFPNKNINNFEA